VGRVGALVLVVAAGAVAAAVAQAARSPQQWRAAMLDAASSRHSVHYVSSTSQPGWSIRFVSDVGRGRGIQRITFTRGGRSGPATVLVVPHTAYIRGSAFTLRNYFALSPAQASRYGGKWISVPSSAKSYTPVAADATLESFLAHLLPRKHLAVVRATIAGRKSVGVRGAVRQAGLQVVETVYAPAGGEPLPFEERATPVGHPGLNLARMSRWNEPVHVAAPAHAVPISTVLAH
jgi:hypothetical protein